MLRKPRGFGKHDCNHTNPLLAVQVLSLQTRQAAEDPGKPSKSDPRVL